MSSIQLSRICRTYGIFFTVAALSASAIGGGCGPQLLRALNSSSAVQVSPSPTPSPAAPDFSSSNGYFLYPLDGSNEPILQGAITTLSRSIAVPNPSVITTIKCLYQSVGMAATDPNYAAASTDCASLDSLGTTNGTLVKGKAVFTQNVGAVSGALAWQPTSNQRGVYKFTYQAMAGAAVSGSRDTYVAVRENYSATQLRLGLESYLSGADASLSGAPSVPRYGGSLNDLSSWLGLTGLFAGDLSAFGTTTPWSGAGTAAAPYALNFSGAALDRMSMGATLTSQTRMMGSAWLSPAASTALGTAILTNGTLGGSGFTLRQANEHGKVELFRGQKAAISYMDMVMSANPTYYWRLGEAAGSTSGATAYDVMGALNGTYSYSGDCPTLNQGGALPNDNDSSAYFKGIGGVAFGFNAIPTTSAPTVDIPFSIEAWVRADDFLAMRPIFSEYRVSGSKSLMFRINTTGNLALDLYTDATHYIGRSYSVPLSALTWYHVVATYDGSKASTGIKLYVNGAPVDDTNDNAGVYSGMTNSSNPMIGTDHELTMGFKGRLDEVAFFATVLSPSVVAGHYAATNVARCSTRQRWNTGTWSFLSWIYDGSNLSLFQEGELQCNFSAPGLNIDSSANFLAGTQTNLSAYWSGAIADLKVSATQGAVAGTGGVVISDFTASANRFRATPVEDVVTTGLLLHLDAANSDRGIRSQATGCTANNSSWFDLSPTRASVNSPIYDPCGGGGVGWLGTGAVASPYRFHGSDAYVNASGFSFGDGAGNDLPFSVELWIRPINLATALDFFCKGWVDGVHAEYEIWKDTSGQVNFNLYKGTNANVTIGRKYTTALTAGTWTHVVGTYDGSKTEAGVKIYINGVRVDNATASAGAGYNGMAPLADAATVAGCSSNAYVFDGDTAVTRVYGTALNANQIKQNCLAQEGRFTAVPQSICGAP